MKPARVLLIAPSLRITGGQAVQASRLRERLSAETDIAIHFQAIDPTLPAPLSALQRIPLLRTCVNTGLFIASLMARMPRTDVVHIFSAGDFSFYLSPTPALLIARLFRRPAILNYRDGRAPQQLEASALARRILSLPTVIVTPSDYLVEVFAHYGVKAQSIFNIIELERFRFRPRAPLRPVFLHNRAFEQHYDVACTLRAFRIIQDQFADASLTLAHDGPLRLQLEHLARELGLRNTRFVGRQDAKRMAALYDQADIYLNTPRVDNMPGSLLEAYACGLPVVSTDAGGIPYIAAHEKTALLVPAGDHQAVADAALRLLANPVLADRLAATAAQQVRRYTWPEIREQWLSLYCGLLQNAGRTEPVPGVPLDRV